MLRKMMQKLKFELLDAGRCWKADIRGIQILKNTSYDNMKGVVIDSCAEWHWYKNSRKIREFEYKFHFNCISSSENISFGIQEVYWSYSRTSAVQ